MSRLVWDNPGQKKYEAGVDRGVFYFNGSGEAWDGIVSINESVTGGEIQEYYMDGMKYAQTVMASDYSATLEAFSSPDTFSLCDGRKEIYSGFIATNQKRLKFDLSYRTLIGNDIIGLDHGYKIHLVSNVIATSAGSNHQTIGDSTDPVIFQWELKTVPSYMDSYGIGIRPTAHIIIDSTKADKAKLAELEAYIYGDDLNDARFPSLTTVKDIFNA